MRSCWQALRPCGSAVRVLWFSRSSRKAVQPCACTHDPGVTPEVVYLRRSRLFSPHDYALLEVRTKAYCSSFQAQCGTRDAAL